MPPAFVQEGMRLVAQDDLIAAPAVRQHRRQVAHRARGHKQAGLFAQALGGHLLQAVDGGVFAVDIVPHLGLAMASRMAGVGWVTVSERKSMICMGSLQ